MYVVKINGIVAHDPSLYDETKIIASGTVSKKVNSADTFNFTIYPDNVCYNQIDSNSEVWVEVLKNGNNIFYGRMLKEETGWDNEKKITCEGLLALFNDSVLRPYEYQGSVLGYINYLVNQHNAQMNGTKQFIVRNVTVTDPNDNIVRSNSDYTKTITELIDKTAGSSLGGYLIVEYLNDAYYLDYLADSVQGTNQTLAFGENILDFQRSIDSESMATAIIPLGAKSDETGEYLTISSVNDGRDYIENSEAVSNRGLIFTTYRWEDVTVPANLLRKATALLSDLTRIVPKINLSAVDLTEAGYNIDEIGFFEYVTVSDTAHDVNGQYLITERTYDLLSPENDKVTFGSDDKTISGQASRNQNSVAAVSSTVLNQARAIIEYQTELLKGGEGGYFVVGTDTDGHPSEIYFLDTNNRDTARSVLRINKNGIGFSTTGFDGPYTNAWTIDGHLNASYITTGTLKDAATNGQKFSFNLETGEMYLDALDILVGGLYVGGRNYLWAISEEIRSVFKQNADYTYSPYNSGKYVVTATASNATSQIYLPKYDAPDELKGKKCVLHADSIIPSNETINPRAYVLFYNSSGTNFYSAFLDKDNLSKEIEVPQDATHMAPCIRVAQNYADMSSGDSVSVTGFKLEKGAVSTDWTPAPEDTDAFAEKNTSAQILANNNNIMASVSSTYTSKANSAIVNMLPSTYLDEYKNGKIIPNNGITWTINDDGSVTATGTATADSYFGICGEEFVNDIFLDSSKKYTLSGCPSGGSASGYSIILHAISDSRATGVWDGSLSGRWFSEFGNGITFGSGYRYAHPTLKISKNYACPSGGVIFHPQLEIGDAKHGYVSTHNGSTALGELIKTNKASIELQDRKVALVVEEKNGQNVIKSASIVTAINDDSSVTINANRINLQGAVTISSLDSAAQAALLTGTTVKTQYYLSTSSSSATGGTWYDSPNSITWQSGSYVWTRVATTKTNASGTSSTTYSNAVYDKQLTTALSKAASAETAAGEAQTTANSTIKESVPIYYRSMSSTTPTLVPGETSVYTTDNTDDRWSVVAPRPKRGAYFWEAVRYTLGNNSRAYSAVRALTSEQYASKWVSSADAAYIDGGAIYANSVTADKINVTDLQAFGATIGGFTIDATSIRSAELTSTASAAIGLSTADFSRSIGGTSRSGLRLAIGSGFGVSKTGILYASDAVISGKITSSNATITGGSISITTGDGGFNVGQNLGIRYFHPNNSLAYQMQTDQTAYFDNDGTTRYTFTTSSGFTFYDANEAIISQFPANRADRVISNNGSAVSLASKTSGMTNLTNISLQHAGLYLLLCTVRFTTNATGYRFACLSTTSTGSSPVSWSAQVITQAATGNGTYVSFPAFVNVSSTATYYLNARQNSGSAVSTTGFINAIKIA